jgi:hypothetical protein
MTTMLPNCKVTSLNISKLPVAPV